MHFYLQLSPRNTRSTRLPYTTLFRSAGEAGVEDPSRRAGVPQLVRQPFVRHPGVRGPRGAGQLEVDDLDCAVRADRKSTRLNSSHLVISYAVFCLKKKNTKMN